MALCLKAQQPHEWHGFDHIVSEHDSHQITLIKLYELDPKNEKNAKYKNCCDLLYA